MKKYAFCQRFLSLFCLAWLILSLGHAQAVGQSFEGELQTAAANLSKDLVRSGVKKVAVADILDYSGHVNMLGRFIADSMATQLFMTLTEKSGNQSLIELVERTRLSAILRELKLSASGLVNPENARKIGNVAGVDALIIGNMVQMGDSIAVNLRVISTENARILSARQFRFLANSSFMKLLKVKLKASVSPDSSGGSHPSNEVVESAEEDAGSVVKTSYFIVRPLAATYQNGILHVSMSIKNYTNKDVFLAFISNSSSITTNGGANCKVTHASPFPVYEDYYFNIYVCDKIYRSGSIVKSGTVTSVTMIAKCEGDIGDKLINASVGLHIGVKNSATKRNNRCKRTKTALSVGNIPIKMINTSSGKD